MKIGKDKFFISLLSSGLHEKIFRHLKQEGESTWYWEGTWQDSFFKEFPSLSRFDLQNSQIFKVYYWKWVLEMACEEAICLHSTPIFYNFIFESAECKAPWNCIFRINLFSFFCSMKSFLALFSFCRRRWHDPIWITYALLKIYICIIVVHAQYYFYSIFFLFYAKMGDGKMGQKFIF